MTQYYSRSQTTAATTVAQQGEQGEQGIPGTSGNSLRSGHGTPSSLLGVDGDTYLDLDTFNLYQKSGGAYVLAGNIQGPPGEANIEMLTLNLEGLEGGTETRLDGIDVDALNIAMHDSRIVTINGQSGIWQIVAGVPGANDVAVLNHSDWHWQRTL